ncbi:hypothetical protein ACFSTE_04675 [Aquimarina hainanensis]|uniref:Uncharacterized protein n=1 Tax=Aquimarina hainanensis TaxID=1578017 RepID=A0ABW5N4K8_9FLAO
MIKLPKLFIVVLCSLSILSQFSCNNDDDDANTNCENIVCTAIFIRINVSITDEHQNPVALDSFKVINRIDGTDMTLSLSPSELSAAKELGQYPLVEDGVLGVHQQRHLQFKGFINNQEVIYSNYTVGMDCCHVSLVSGSLQLTL